LNEEISILDKEFQGMYKDYVIIFASMAIPTPLTFILPIVLFSREEFPTVSYKAIVGTANYFIGGLQHAHAN
jgi:hypothetical protein